MWCLREDTASVKLILLWILAAKAGSVAVMLDKSWSWIAAVFQSSFSAAFRPFLISIGRSLQRCWAVGSQHLQMFSQHSSLTLESTRRNYSVSLYYNIENGDPVMREAVLNFLEQGKWYLKAKILKSLFSSSSLSSCHSYKCRDRVSYIGSGSVLWQITRLFQPWELFLIHIVTNL